MAPDEKFIQDLKNSIFAIETNLETLHRRQHRLDEVGVGALIGIQASVENMKAKVAEQEKGNDHA